MIVSGECTACRRAFLARGRRARREPPQWTIEERGRGCSHRNDLLQAINLAAVRPDGRATVASVRARREPDSRAWDVGAADRALPEWGLIASDGELIFRLRARDAIGARELF